VLILSGIKGTGFYKHTCKVYKPERLIIFSLWNLTAIIRDEDMSISLNLSWQLNRTVFPKWQHSFKFAHVPGGTKRLCLA